MSVVAAMDQKHELKGPPSPCDVAELANKMALTSIKEHSGNNLDLVTGDLSPTEEKDSGFSSEEGPEYDVADPIDHLASLSERDIDDTVLEELGPGEKRSRDATPQEDREEGTPCKRSSFPAARQSICPPPQHLSRLRLTPADPAPGAKAATTTTTDDDDACTKPGLQHPSPPPRVTNAAARRPPQYAISGGGDGRGRGGGEAPYFPPFPGEGRSRKDSGTERPTTATATTAVPPFLALPPPHHHHHHQQPILSDDGGGGGGGGGGGVVSWLQAGHSDLPTEVSVDGSSAAQEEEKRQIQRILKDLIFTSPQEDCPFPASFLPQAAPPFANPRNPVRTTSASSAAVQNRPGPAGPGFPTQADAWLLGRRPEGWASPPAPPPPPLGPPKGEHPVYPPQRGVAGETRARTSVPAVASPPQRSLANPLPDPCTGPPPMQATGPPRRGRGEQPQTLRRALPAGNGPATAPLLSSSSETASTVLQALLQRTRSARTLPESSLGSGRLGVGGSSLALTSPAAAVLEAGGVPTADGWSSFLKTTTTTTAAAAGSGSGSSSSSPGPYQRQDSGSSEASCSSAHSSVRSWSGQTTRTCLSSMAACGATVTCNDAVCPPTTTTTTNLPPPPFSPPPPPPRSSSSSSWRDGAQVGGPESPISHASPPAASPCSSCPPRASPRAYSLPPTPESDCCCPSVKGDSCCLSASVKSDCCCCQSPRGRSPGDASPTPTGCQARAKPLPEPLSPLSSSSSSGSGGGGGMVIGSVGLPTPPYRWGADDAAASSSSSSSSSFSFHHPLSPVPPSPNLPSRSLVAAPSRWPSCANFAHVGGGVACGGVVPPKEEGRGKEEVEVVEEEEEEVDFEEEVVEGVLDVVCDEHGVWQTDDDDGDNFVHSLSGMPKEVVAVQYLHRLHHKPGFLQALNSFNSRLETPLYTAVCLGKGTLVAHMLQVGADVNIQCRFGDKAHTALHRAVERGESAMVDVLLRSDRINLNARRGSDHCTALMVALMRHVAGNPRHDRLDIISKIMEEDDGLDLQARDPRSGKTALMMAIETKDTRVVDAMLNDLDLDTARHLINMQNRAGNSAVHVAAGLRDILPQVKKHMLRRLIELGGDTNKRNNEGETPKHWAQHLIDQVARLQ